MTFLKSMSTLADKMNADAKAVEFEFNRIRPSCPDRRPYIDYNYKGKVHSRDFSCRKVTGSPENRQNNLYFCRLCNCPHLP